MYNVASIAEEAIDKLEKWITIDSSEYFNSDLDDKNMFIDQDVDSFFDMIVDDHKDTEAFRTYVSENRGLIVDYIVENV